MRELRYVGPGGDPDHVIVETLDGGEQFSMPVAAVVAQSTQTDLLGAPAPTVAPSFLAPPADVAEPAPEDEPMTVPSAPAVELSPRDIQVRVRAGESPEELAESSGDTLARIMRFAGPVLAERARITDEARRGRARRNGADAQSVTFGPAVDERFGAHKVPLSAVAWDAYRRGDGTWIVTATWTESAGGETRQADWSFNLTTRTVTPLDDHAVELLSDRPIPLPRPTGETRPTLTVAPPPAPDVVPFPAQPDTYTSPLPRDDVFDQEAFDQAPTATSPVPVPPVPSRPAAKAVRAVPTPAPEPTPAEAPELPLDLPEPVSPAAAVEPEDEDAANDEPADDAPKVTNLGVAHRPAKHRSAKPAMPSWDDILMGVRRKTD